MPHVSTRLGRAEFLRIVFADENAVEDAFGGRDLVRAHHQQVMLGGEHAISRQDIEQCMPGEEGSGETRQVGDDMVAPVGPPAGEFETVGALLRTACCGTALHFMDVLEARGVAVVLGVRAVRDDEDLGVLIESRSGPEAVALATVDLVERLLDRHAPPLQLDLHQRQAIDQNRHIIPGRVAATLLLELVKHLEAVAVNMHLVDETNVLCRTIITVQNLDVVFLDQPGLVLDACRRRGDDPMEEMRPLIVGEPDIVQLLKLGAQVCDQFGFRMRGKSFIALGFKDSQQLLLQIRFALVRGLTTVVRLVFGHHGAFRALGHELVRLAAIRQIHIRPLRHHGLLLHPYLSAILLKGIRIPQRIWDSWILQLIPNAGPS